MRASSNPLLILPLVACLALPAAADGAWPFGRPAGAGPFAEGQDLWCLGLLGAKARDPDAGGPAASEDMGGGKRRIAGEGRPANDGGPSRLEVAVLFPGGPADRAGLAVGDVIVGVGRSPFKAGARDALAAALVKAEAGKAKGKLTLLVERAGDRERIEVQIPVAGKDAAKPTHGAARERVLQAALAWLAERQDANGGFAETLSGRNGAVVMASLAGLAWLAAGSDLEQGPYREQVEKAAAFVAEGAGETSRLPPGARGGSDRASRMQGMDQSNWGWAHAAIFLGELEARSPAPKIRAALQRCGETLATQQEPSGGWAHGPGGPNPLGYTELNIVTGLALCGLGMAQRAGWEVPAGVLEQADAYLRASSGGDGGVGYADSPGQRGQGNIGRTAGAWLGYRLLGRGRTDWCRKLGKWTERHVDDVLGGHASLMQHVLLSGVAAHALGGKAQKRWWDALETDLVLARAPDGSLQARPWHESLQMGSNSDVTFGEVWTTAAWAVVLGCEPVPGSRPGLPVWLGR
jgi:hypothetical protein